MINQAAMTKWVEALESDEFINRQTRGRMVTPAGRRMCAIGLLDYVYLVEHGREPTPETVAEGTTQFLAAQWLGVSPNSIIGETEDGQRFTTMRANDGLKMTFPEIAQHLRKKFL